MIQEPFIDLHDVQAVFPDRDAWKPWDERVSIIRWAYYKYATPCYKQKTQI